MKTFLWQNNALKAITAESLGALITDNNATPTDIMTLYREVAWFRRGVDLISQAVASMPRTLHVGTSKDGNVIEEHEATIDLNLASNLDAFAADIILHGAAYAAVWKNSYGYAKTLVRMVPTSILPIYSPEMGLEKFVRQAGAISIAYKPNTPSEFMYCWMNNRRAEVGNEYGAAHSAVKAARALYNMGVYIDGYFANGAINPTLISVDGNMQKQDFDRLKAWYKKLLTGVKKAFSLEVISGEIKATTIGYAPKDLAARELIELLREDIASGLGIPQSVLFSAAANYATAQTDVRSFYTLTIIPLVNKLFTALNKTLHALGYHVEAHPEKLEMFQSAEVEKATAMVSLLQAGIMTLDEVRGYLGLSASEPDHPASDAPTDVQHAEPTAKSSDVNDEYWFIDRMKAELRTLGKVARTRLGEGKLAKIQSFSGEYIPDNQLSALKAQLQDCVDADGIDRVIGAALNWSDVYG